MNIQITDLSREITEQELTELFQVYGKVVSTTIITDKETGKSKGFGFIEMPHQKDAQVAITKLNKKKVGDQKIRVKEVNSKK